MTEKNLFERMASLMLYIDLLSIKKFKFKYSWEATKTS